MDVRINNSLAKIQTSFDEIAQKMLDEYILEVKGHQFRIINIEFYYYEQGLHEDGYTHMCRYQRAKIRQLLNGKWYLHQISINPNARNGLDYTIGDNINFGGILIKEAICIDDCRRFTQSKFINELVTILNPNDKNDFLDMIEQQNILQFIRLKQQYNDKIITTVRKGLNPNIPQNTLRNEKYAYKVEKYFN